MKIANITVITIKLLICNAQTLVNCIIAVLFCTITVITTRPQCTVMHCVTAN